MSAINEGGPAFPMPFKHGELDHSCEGMTLRDYFAAKALVGLLAGPMDGHVSEFSRWSYELADAMLAAREVEK